MATLNNKKKARDQVSCERDLNSAIREFGITAGVPLAWLKKHLDVFIDGRSSMFYLQERDELKLVEPMCGVAMSVIPQKRLKELYDGRIDVDELAASHRPWNMGVILSTNRPAFDGDLVRVTKDEFFGLSMVKMFRKWLLAVLKDAEAEGFSVHYGVGHANMVLLENSEGKQFAFTV